MEEGIRQLKLGSLARLHVPSHLAYGANTAGVIPPHADLVFEVELLKLAGRSASPKDIRLIRRLLALPAAPGVSENVERVLVPQDALLAAGIEVRWEGGRAYPHPQAPSPSSDAPSPEWLRRLRSALPLPTPECKSFFTFLSDFKRTAGAEISVLIPSAHSIPQVERQVEL